MPTFNELHAEQRPQYEFRWDDNQILLRDVYGDLEFHELIDEENSLALFTAGGWFGTRGGRAEFAFILDKDESVGIAETRDFEDNYEDGQSYPLWGNSRVVPHNHELFDEIQTILTTLRGH